MIAGATTKASSAIGAVTEAQMARIFVSEYWLELAGTSRCADSVCVFVMSSASRGTWVYHIARRARDRRLSYAARVMRMSAGRVMCGGTWGRTVFAWSRTRR
jgi:hypothetical protein